LLAILLITAALLLPDSALAGSDPRQDSAAYASSRAASALKSQQIEKAFPGLSFSQEMVHLTHSGDGTNRLWIVLRPGVIMVFPNNSGVSSASVFLDIADRVNDQGQEEGLLGLVFDPHYKINGYFYVNYTAANPRRSVISRFSVASSNPGQANASSELIILQVNQPFANHNGGTLEFGNDGYLYIALGDGGSAGDPFGNGQNKNTLLGKILRIDVSSATTEEPYRIPSDNPFVGEPSGVRKEIWAYGLRNP
jgi:glucose/arabinose dehydrogenase